MAAMGQEKDKGGLSNPYGVLVAFYAAPLILYSIYALKTMPGLASWGVVSLGLLLTTLGATNLLLQLRRWEFAMRARCTSVANQRGGEQQKQPAAHHPETAETANDERAPEEEYTLSQELDGRDTAIRTLKEELEELRQKSIDLDEQVKSSHMEASHKESLLQDYQQTIGEQRSIIDKKQQYISRLEAQVQDLNYEVKTLLKLGDLSMGGSPGVMEAQSGGDSAHPAMNVFQGTAVQNPDLDAMMEALPVSSEKKVHTHYDAAVHLQKFLEQAKKLTGASHLGGKSSRFLDLSVDSYAIDLRRLFDSFRNETSCAVLFYSPGENRVLFVNDQIKGMLGWSPEKFVKDFDALVGASHAEWRHAIRLLDSQGEAQTRLTIKNKDGEEALLHCYLGKIASGAFEKHVIGVLYHA